MRSADGRRQVAVVIQRIVHRQYLDTPPGQHLCIQSHNVVGEEFKSIQTLAPRQGIAGRAEVVAQQGDALPGILLEITHADVEHGAAKDIDIGIAHLVERLQNRRHHGRGHARGPQTLMAIA